MTDATDPPEPRPHVLVDLTATDPERLIHEAIEWACQQRIPVSVDGDTNVRLTSRNPPTWERDNSRRPVSVLGACILRYQPQAPSLRAAHWMSVGQTQKWVEAFEVGCSGAAKPASWEAYSASRLMTHGYLLGFSIWNAASQEVCKAHEEKFKRGEVCPRCLEEDAQPTPHEPRPWGSR